MSKTQKRTQIAKLEESTIKIPTSPKEVPATIEALKAQLAILKGNEDKEVSTDIAYDHRNIKDIPKVSCSIWLRREN